MGIEVTNSGENNETVMKIDGRFDFSLHKDFRESYKDAQEGQSYVVDMSGADYMDSSALGMLLLLREHAGNDNANIKITGCQPAIKQIFSISNFDKLFDIS